jgi:hypothetical protein
MAGAAAAANPSASADLRLISFMVLSLKFSHALSYVARGIRYLIRLFVNEANEPVVRQCEISKLAYQL